MATVINNVTRINDVEGTLTLSSIGGGQGGSANTDVFIQASQSAGRRSDAVTAHGFLLDDGVSTTDLTPAGTHCGAWMWVTHYAVLTRIDFAIGSSTSAYDRHTLPLSEYPALGGWVKVWVDVSRTPETTAGGGATLSAARYYGPVIDIGNVGGNAQNNILDAIDSTVSGFDLTGATGKFQDFVDYDEGDTTNTFGLVNSLSEIVFCKGRLNLGGSDALDFTDSQFNIVFPQQSLVADDFMGVTVHGIDALTDINLDNGSFNSPGTKKGDFIVTGDDGTLSINGVTFAGLRRIQLGTIATVTASTISACNTGIHDGGTISSSTISDTLLVTTSPGGVSNSTFISTGAGGGHGMEILVTGEYTLSNVTWSNFGASGSTDAAIYNNSGGDLTLNVAGGTTPTYRNGAGATTSIVADPATLTLTNVVSGSEVRIYTAGTTGELYGIETTDGVTDPAYVYTETGFVDIVVHNIDYNYLRIDDYPLQTTDASLPIAQVFDRNYDNP